jgi:hypothetical protein
VYSENALMILSQPQDYTGELGSTATFTVEAQGEGLTYLWQSNATGEWAKTTFASSKSATLSVKITTARDGKQYRCVVTDANGKTYTETMTRPKAFTVNDYKNK